jgi:uncharacterized protein involved in exopolysaccharide biosynthesis
VGEAPEGVVFEFRRQATAIRIGRALLWALSAGILAAGVTFFIPKTYRAQTKILPTRGGSSTLSSELLDAAGVSGALGGMLGGADNAVLTFPEIITSTVVLERTLQSPYPPGDTDPRRTTLLALGVHGDFDRTNVYKGVRKLREAVTVSANPRSGIITIAVVARDSVLAAHVANTLVLELDRFNIETRASKGKASREFIQERLQETQRDLSAAEARLDRFLEANVRIGNSPALLSEQTRLRRDVDIQSDLYRLLARQYEMARVEERRDTPTFTVLETARPPVRKFRPHLVLNVLAAALAAGTMSIFLSIVALRRPRAEAQLPDAFGTGAHEKRRAAN